MQKIKFQDIISFFKNVGKKKEKKNESFIDHVKVFFSTYLLALFIRAFFIEASQIPSQSMVPSLLVGDTLMVEKVSLGTYIPVINKKVPSFSQPHVNDMVVFISPEWQKPSIWDELITFFSLSLINKDNTFQNPKILVKRIVAGPGDSISMNNGAITYNGKLMTSGPIASQNQVFYLGGRRKGSMAYDLFEEKTEKFSRVVQHVQDSMEMGENSLDLYKEDNFIYLLRSLLTYSFPEITIPQKNVEIDFSKISKYERYLLVMLIQKETGIFTKYHNGKIIQNDKEIRSWIPKDNYYFMMGDNRDYSEDSRYFGYVPQQSIYGRVLFRYWPLSRFNFNVNAKKEVFIKKKPLKYF